MRQRMVKPEFFDSESLRACSVPARLAFIGLMIYSNDEGNQKLSAGRLRSFIFEDEFDDEQFARMLGELESVGCIKLYVVDGNPYINIPNFTTYQTINRPQKSAIPKPSQKVESMRTTSLFRCFTDSFSDSLSEPITLKERMKEIKNGAAADADAAAPLQFDPSTYAVKFGARAL